MNKKDKETIVCMFKMLWISIVRNRTVEEMRDNVRNYGNVVSIIDDWIENEKKSKGA